MPKLLNAGRKNVRIQWTKNASHNLEQIEEYIAQDNSSAAANVVLKIINSIEMLIEHPALGKAGRVGGTRELIIAHTPYIVPYRIKGENIEVLRVLHSAMQWQLYPKR
jgi:toxin ParE1/3/4